MPQQGQCVIAQLAFRRRRVSLKTVGPAPKDLEPAPVPDDGIEGGEQPYRIVDLPARRLRPVLGRPIPIDTVKPRMVKSLLGARQRRRALRRPLWNTVAQAAYEQAEARCRERCVLSEDRK